jgi:hypothetical protein
LVADGEPESGRVIGAGERMTGAELVVAGCGLFAPVAGLVGLSRRVEQDRELRAVPGLLSRLPPCADLRLKIHQRDGMGSGILQGRNSAERGRETRFLASRQRQLDAGHVGQGVPALAGGRPGHVTVETVVEAEVGVDPRPVGVQDGRSVTDVR